MKRTIHALGLLAMLLVFGAFSSTRAIGQAAITNPRVLATTVGANEVGTGNTQFVFAADIAPSDNMHALINIGNAVGGGNINSPAAVVIDPFDNANPEAGGRVVIPMAPKFVVGATIRYVAYISGYTIGVNDTQAHNWSIVARDNNTGGTFKNGVNAGPKPAPKTVWAVTGQTLEILPVDQNFQPDKRANPGQFGNGLRVDPQDSTSPNDGSGAHFYTWRVRVRDASQQVVLVPHGLVPQLANIRAQYDWRDPRAPFESGVSLWDVTKINSPVFLVLIDPTGIQHYCPMEFDPDAPNATNYAGTYPLDVDPDGVNTQLLHPVGNLNTWSGNGIFFRYRMLPTQYQFNWGPLPGEGPFTAFGGPTFPDLIPAIPIGANGIGNEVIGRPFANEYAAFAGEDRVPFAPPFPYYTNIAGRAGQWKYYYAVTEDLRPVDRGGFNTNGDLATYSRDGNSDRPGLDPGAYLYNTDSDMLVNGAPPGPTFGDPNQPYQHPFVTPILSDGGWTDDLPENGYVSPAGVSSNSHRSRVTTKTRVRFMVRVTKPDNASIPAQAVRVVIDGNAHAMVQGTAPQFPNNNDFVQGVIFYFDTTFPAGTEGQHFTYFLYDDGVHRSIWPRRDSGVGGSTTGDARYVDPQANLLPAQAAAVDFPTGTIGKNYLNEPFVNHRPTLTNATVTPPSGTVNQSFTFSVVYTDLDNDEPVDTPATATTPAYVGAAVIIDGVEHRMTPANNNPTSQGRQYTFTTNLVVNATGSHSYYFRFRDNWNSLQAYGVSPLRREDGEFVTFPAGDDKGTPAFTITGPAISGNHAAEVTDPSYSFSDAAETPATLFDFTARYRDADNQAPQLIQLFLSKDGGATWDTGHGLVPAENSTNYSGGVLYHLASRIQLAASSGTPYQYRFEANDGNEPVNTTLIHVGTGPINSGPNQSLTDKFASVLNGTAHELKLVSANTFGDPNGTVVNPSTLKWSPAGLNLLITRNGAPFHQLLPSEYNVNLVAGLVTLKTPLAATDKLYGDYFYYSTVGPLVNVNKAPSLAEPTPGTPATNNGTISALAGAPTTSFTYSVIYSDPDNQAPSFVNVVIDTVTNPARPMTMDPATPTPPNYRTGVKYTYSTMLGVGPHTYHFEASDGQDTARLPLVTASPAEYSGPTVTDNTNLGSEQIQPFPKGKHNDLYTFTVTYTNPQGNAPPQGGLEVRLTPVAPAIPGQVALTVPLNAIDPIGGPQFQAGVRYQVALSSTTTPALRSGAYNVVFGFANSPLTGTAPLVLTVNAQPVLSGPKATPNPQTQSGDITFAVKYTDANGDPPAGTKSINLFIDGKVAAANGANIVPTTTPATPTNADFRAGVIYNWDVPASALTIGTHKYYFEASDDTEDANPVDVPAPPGNTVTVKAAQLPQLVNPTPNTPATNNGTLTPLKGALSGQYTYSVIYKHGDDVAPVTIQLLIDAGTPNAKTIDLQPAAGQTQPYNYANGIKYTYQTQPGDLASGPHTYYFEAKDRVATVDLPANAPTSKLNGPTINFAPVLTAGTVFPVGATTNSSIDANNALQPPVNGNTTTKFVFQATYADQDFVAGSNPTVTVTINGNQTLTLTPKAGQTLDAAHYKTGIIYTTAAAGTALSAGQKAFHFSASDGLDSVLLPATAGSDITGLNVANVAELDAPTPNVAANNFGTIDKLVGPLSTQFNYSIIYKNADGTAPAFVNLIIDGNTANKATIAMTTTGASPNYSAGVTYTAKYRFNTGSAHNYRFEAADTVSPNYIAQYPVGTNNPTLAGPTINIASFQQPVFTPAKGVVGQPMSFTSKLLTNTPLGQPISIELVRPDGTGETDTVNTDPATGAFTFTFTPAQTGDWRVRLSWGGQNGVYDPVTNEFAFQVTGFSISLLGGETDMIASPLVPTTPDPSITLNPNDGANPPVAVPITAVNVIRWIPSGDQSRYSFLNTDGNFPGITGGGAIWVKPTRNVVLSPRGRMWDQTQPYNIQLQEGWNMIGTVYLSDINWSAVKVQTSSGQLVGIGDAAAGSLIRPVAWTYSKSVGAYTAVNLPDGVLSTGRGYWVHALQPVTLVLAPPGTRAVNPGRAAFDQAASVQIVARTANHADQDNYAPMTSAGNSRLVLMEKPPYLSNYVSVKFVGSGIDQLPAEHRAAAVNSSNVVVFDVVTDQAKTDVQLVFPNLSTLGRKVDVQVVDYSNNTRSMLGTSAGVTYNTSDNTKPRRFALIMSTRALNGSLVISNLRTTDSGRSVSGNSAMAFSFNVSAAANMQVQVVGGASQHVVRTLTQGRAAAQGENSITWDGRDSRGVPVAAGTYLLHLSVTDDKGHSAQAVLPVVVVR